MQFGASHDLVSTDSLYTQFTTLWYVYLMTMKIKLFNLIGLFYKWDILPLLIYLKLEMETSVLYFGIYLKYWRKRCKSCACNINRTWQRKMYDYDFDYISCTTYYSWHKLPPYVILKKQTLPKEKLSHGVIVCIHEKG